MFSIENNRHNKSYLERQKKEILTDQLEYINKLNTKDLKNKAQPIEPTNIYLSVLSLRVNIIKKGEKNKNSIYYTIYLSPTNIKYISEQELKKYN